MLILGLGSNLGDSLNNLRLAVQLLQQLSTVKVLKISPIYRSSALLPPQAPINWNKPYLNIALACQSSLTPMDFLATVKGIEQQLGREPTERWAPRIIDIDILVWDNYQVNHPLLQIPHPELEKRPFALWPLLDLLPTWQPLSRNLSKLLYQWGSRFSGKSPFNTQQLVHRLFGTRLMGILNITPDSFSDGGHFTDVMKALNHAEKLIKEGAEVLDIGAESTRPGAQPISVDVEWNRLLPVLKALKANTVNWPIKPKLSIDTRHYEIAERALEFGIDWVNDVSGFEDSRMCDLVSKSDLKCIVMHNLGIPADKKIVLSPYPSIFLQILRWATQRFEKLISLGVKPEQLIFDIGIGFGKTASQSIFILKNIHYFRQLQCPLLVGHSRKSFLKLLTVKEENMERDFKTAQLSYQLAMSGSVDYLRVHNVSLNAHAIGAAEKYKNPKLSLI